MSLMRSSTVNASSKELSATATLWPAGVRSRISSVSFHQPDDVQPDMLYADLLDKFDEQLAHLSGTRPMVVG